MELAGASRSAALRGEEPLASHSSYFRGSDPWQWRRNVSHFSRHRASNVYRGVDVECDRGAHGLESDFIVVAAPIPRKFSLSSKTGAFLWINRVPFAIEIRRESCWPRLSPTTRGSMAGSGSWRVNLGLSLKITRGSKLATGIIRAD